MNIDAISSLYSASYSASTSYNNGNGGSSATLSFSAYMASATAAVDTTDGGSATDAIATFAEIRTRYTQDVYELLFPSKANAGSGSYKTLDEVAGDFENDFNQLTGILGQVFQMAGVSFENTISMSLDGVGGITVSQEGGDGDAASTAKSFFSGDNSMVSRFAVMAARGAITQAATSVGGFDAAYQEDPAGAIREYIGDLENLLFGFTLTAGADGMDYHF